MIDFFRSSKFLICNHLLLPTTFYRTFLRIQLHSRCEHSFLGWMICIHILMFTINKKSQVKLWINNDDRVRFIFNPETDSEQRRRRGRQWKRALGVFPVKNAGDGSPPASTTECRTKGHQSRTLSSRLTLNKTWISRPNYSFFNRLWPWLLPFKHVSSRRYLSVCLFICLSLQVLVFFCRYPGCTEKANGATVRRLSYRKMAELKKPSIYVCFIFFVVPRFYRNANFKETCQSLTQLVLIKLESSHVLVSSDPFLIVLKDLNPLTSFGL